MSPLLLTAFLALGAPDEGAAAAPKVDGKWRIVYAEEAGRRNTAWEEVVATVSDNTLTYEREGKKLSLHLTFSPNQTLKASFGGKEGAKKERSGVYVASQDYLVISLTGGGKAPKGDGKEATADTGKTRGASSGTFILILRRQK